MPDQRSSIPWSPGSTDGDGDYALYEEADVRISVVGPPIREAYKFHALDNGRADDTKRVIEFALEQVGIRLDRFQRNPDPYLLCGSRNEVRR